MPIPLWAPMWAPLWVGAMEKSPLEQAIDRAFLGGQQGFAFVYQPVLMSRQILFKDAAGTDPVTAHLDPVGFVRDLSPNGRHATQPDPNQRLIYHTDGVYHWLQGDGFNDHLIVPNLAGVNGDAVTVVFGGISVGGTDTEYIVDNKNDSLSKTGDGGFMLGKSANDTTGISWSVSNGVDVNRLNSGPEITWRRQGTYGVLTARFENAVGKPNLQELRVLGSQIGTQATLATLVHSANDVLIGKGHVGSPFQGPQHGIFVVTGFMEESDLTLLETHMASRG